MILKERSVFSEVVVSVMVRKKGSYEYMVNSEWLSGESWRFLNLQIQKAL